MITKLKEIYDVANKLWHEDAYDMLLTCHTSGWSLRVTHRYVGKTGTHPETVIFNKPVTEESAETVLTELKASFIQRGAELATFRKQECDKIYAQMKEATDEFTKRLFVLEELKRIA